MIEGALLLALIGVPLVLPLVVYRFWRNPWGVAAVVGFLGFVGVLGAAVVGSRSFDLMMTFFSLLVASGCFLTVLVVLGAVHGGLAPYSVEPDRRDP